MRSPLIPPSSTGLSGNAALALSEIRRRGAVARVDLVEPLDLSFATVSAVTNELMEAALIEEASAPATPGRGRPRTLLRLRPDAIHVAGAKLNDGFLTVAVLDFCGEVLATASTDLPKGRISTDRLVDELDRVLRIALSDTVLDIGDLAAFGFGMAGFIETGSGLCHWSPLLSDAPINVRDRLSMRFSCPVFIDNDANLAALAELWFGQGRHEKNFLVVTVEQGVGLGVVLDGVLFRGARGLGTEFAHTKVQIDGALCRCGQRGCLEAYVADYALLREAGVAVGHGDRSTMLDTLAQQAGEGHEISASIYRRAGRMLGLGLANLINMFDPPLIILSGEYIQHHDLLAEEIERTLHRNALAIDRPPARLSVHRWGDQLWAQGAGALALDGLALEGGRAGAAPEVTAAIP